MNATISRIKITLAVLALAVLATSFCGCKGSDTPALSKKDEVTATLTKSAWVIKTVTVDGVDKTSIYPNIGLTFTSSAFTTTNGGPIWPTSGTWSFTTADATAIQRNDGLVVTIQEATATSLKLALSWTKTTLGGGRVESVSGQHVFNFGK